MRYTEEIHDALMKAVRKYGTRAAVSRRIGIHEAILGRYLNRRHKHISDANAERVMAFLTSEGFKKQAEPAAVTTTPSAIPNTPELRSYIQDGMIEHGRKYPEIARACNMNPDSLRRLLKGELQQWFPANLAKLLSELGLKADEAPLSPGEQALLHPSLGDGGTPTRPCFVLTLSQAASVADILVPFEPDSSWACDVIPIADARDCVAFTIEGDSMMPRILDGDVVICDRNSSPINRKPVVAKVNGRVVCKIYRRIGELIFLESLNPDGQDYENLRTSDIDWILPVLKLQRSI